MWDNPGHIYGNFAIDPGTGDLFIARGGADFPNGRDFARRARWWKHSQRSLGEAAWDNLAPVNSNYWQGGDNSIVSHMNGVAFHPNLYGTNDGGLVVDNQFETIFWRKSTDASQYTNHSEDLYGNKEGCAVFWPAQNWVVVGGAGGENLARVAPNGNTPSVTNLGRPPISTGGHSGGGGFGSLHVHPGNPNKLLILESYGPRAYTSTNGSTWTQIGNHPFSLEPRVLCSLRGGFGCMWAVGVSGSVLWRPPT